MDNLPQKSIEDNTQTHIDPNQPNHLETQQTQKTNIFCTKKVKIISITIITILVLTAVGLGVGLHFKFRQTIDQIGQSTLISSSDGNAFIMGEFHLKDENLIQDDVDIKLLISAPIIPKSPNNRLLQQNQQFQSDYSVTVNMDDAGVQINLNPDNILNVQIDHQALQNYILATQPQTARLLNEVNQTADDQTNLTISEIQQEISKVFNEEFQTSDPFGFKQTSMIKLVLNDTTSNFEILMNQNNNSQSRRLLFVRMLFFKKIVKKVTKVISKVVKPVIKIVKNHGQKIGVAAGALIGGAAGFMVAGPAGAVAGAIKGAKIGGGIGLAVQTVAKACIPDNKITLKCSKQAVIKASLDAGVSVAQSFVCAKTVCPVIEKTLLSNVNLIKIK